MPTWGWVLIGVGALLLFTALILLALARVRTTRLRRRFGPEYDRTVRTAGGKRTAEATLREREQRRTDMSIRALSPADRSRYERDWEQLQGQFVDDPFMAVAGADRLIQSVMVDEGYPVEDFDLRAADLSVDHPRVVENYRRGHELAMASANREGAGTEDLRRAMQHYRSLFAELIAPSHQTSEPEDLPDGYPQGGDEGLKT